MATYDTARINDPFFAALIKLQRDRANFYRQISIGLLVATCLLVACGIGIFLRGDPNVQIVAAEESSLLSKINALTDQINAIAIDTAETRTRAFRLDRTFVLASCLQRVQPNLAAAVETPTWDSVYSVAAAARLAGEVLKALIAAAKEKANDKTVTLDVSNFYPKDSKQFPAESLRELRQFVDKQAVDLDKLSAEIDAVATGAGAINEKRKETDTGELPQLLAEQLRELGKKPDQLLQLASVKDEVDRAKQAAEERRDRSEEQATANEAQRAKLEAQRVKADEQLKEIQLKRDKLLFMAWLPDLTLRAGVVVLLLFLTQVLLNTYRYTMGLSSFYLARSDVIQMLQPTNADLTSYLVEHVRILSEAMSPDSLRIEAVSDPSAYVTRLVETWLGGRKKE